jgi:hypothetical protein
MHAAMTERNARRCRRATILAVFGLLTILVLKSTTVRPGPARFEPAPPTGPVQVVIIDPPPYESLPAWTDPDGRFQILDGRADIAYDIEVLQPGCHPAVVEDVVFTRAGSVVPLPACERLPEPAIPPHSPTGVEQQRHNKPSTGRRALSNVGAEEETNHGREMRTDDNRNTGGRESTG